MPIKMLPTAAYENLTEYQPAIRQVTDESPTVQDSVITASRVRQPASRAARAPHIALRLPSQVSIDAAYMIHAARKERASRKISTFFVCQSAAVLGVGARYVQRLIGVPSAVALPLSICAVGIGALLGIDACRERRDAKAQIFSKSSMLVGAACGVNSYRFLTAVIGVPSHVAAPIGVCAAVLGSSVYRVEKYQSLKEAICHHAVISPGKASARQGSSGIDRGSTRTQGRFLSKAQ